MKTNRSDKWLAISMVVTVACFWVQIICAFVGDRNYVAPWCFLIYMISTLAIILITIDLKTKWAAVRIIVGATAMWSILMLLYIGILALRGFL